MHEVENCKILVNLLHGFQRICIALIRREGSVYQPLGFSEGLQEFRAISSFTFAFLLEHVCHPILESAFSLRGQIK